MIPTSPRTIRVFRHFVFAIGTNEEAVRLSGHEPKRYKIAVFKISGLTASIAAS
ncbi:UNVERIFIED_ORG: ribose transport system permease protein [Rhizobium esperanzae]